MEVQADAVGLIRTLVIIVVAYYAIRFVMRILLPFALTYMAKKAGQRMQNHMHNTMQNNHTQREDLVHDDGKIQIRKPKKSNQSNSDWDGEYVSYEEIKDE